MATPSQVLARADLAISNLSTDGGLLQPEQANVFLDMVKDEPTLVNQVRTIKMKSTEEKINRLGFGSRIMHAARTSGSLNDDGSNDRRMLKTNRSKPDTSQITLTCSEIQADVRLNYETLEDNIEGQSFEAHVMRLIAQQCALDLEELALWGDTSSGDAYLALQNGWIKRATAHVADNLGAGPNPDMFANALLAMPQKYLKYLPQMRGYITHANMTRYRQIVAKRLTGYGDSALQNTGPQAAFGLQLEAAPLLAADGVGATGLVTFPQNLILGIRRDISVETDRDISAREILIVVTMRVGLQIEQTDAVVTLVSI